MNPLFVGGTDYRPVESSPALDAGTDGSSQTSVDLDNTSRPLGSGWDMGCYEVPALDVNYRSVGTGPNPIYSDGLASISSGTRTVTFTVGASLPSNVGQGDKLTIDTTEFHILSRDSATQVTTQETAGGGLTNQFYQIDRAYTDFQSWETASQGNLAADNRREVAVAYDDGDFTPGAPIVIDGSTTDSSRYLKITVAPGQRHAGVAGPGVVVNAGGGVGGDVFYIQDAYTQIEWLQITNFKDGLGDAVEVQAIGGNKALLQSLLVYDFDGQQGGLHVRADTTIRNTVIYDGDRGVYVSSAAPAATLENVTVYGMSGGGIVQSSTLGPAVTVRNTISVGNGTWDFDLPGTVDYFDYNMYDPAKLTGVAPGANDQSPPGSLEALFISIAPLSENLHLEASGHNALDTGESLSGSFLVDIDNETRPNGAAWDIGADEQSGAASKPKIIFWAEVDPYH
jgi:hypothetical protein